MEHKYLFFDDYSEGAHPRLLEALRAANAGQERGYGEDRLTSEAAQIIRKRIRSASADVHFVTGGTQANLVALASMLKPYESVIAAESAHINLHEAGAIEATGHKIHAVKSDDGKLTADAIDEVIARHTDEHMVRPKVIFLSQATELGTIYSKRNLEGIARLAKKYDLYTYLDGARLGVALSCPTADTHLSDLPRFADIFSIGGTKNGALFGEAIVISKAELKRNFRHHMKQRGALLAKGRVLGAQFRELLKDDLFFELARHANTLAAKLAQGIKTCGYSLLVPPVTNQLFPVLPKKLVERLQKTFGFYVWAAPDARQSVARLVTSWATPKEAVETFLERLRKLS